jgi:hypothetical protein
MSGECMSKMEDMVYDVMSKTKIPECDTCPVDDNVCMDCDALIKKVKELITGG